MKEGPKYIDLRDLSTYSISFLAGAIGQVSAESSKVLFYTDIKKLPDGWNSINIPEEILEGGLSAVAGAISAKIIYYFLCTKGIVEYSAKEEIQMMITGAALGYLVMAALLGPVFHHLTGTADVKWGRF